MRSWTENRLLMTIAFLCFAGFGAAMAMFSDGDTRIAGLASLLMFGVGGGAWWIGEFRTARAALPRLHSIVLPTGSYERALVLPLRAGKERAAVAAQAAFGLGSLVLAVLHPLLAIFGLFLCLNAVLTFGRRTRGELYLALTPSGLVVRSLFGTTFMPWAAISNVTVLRRHGQLYLDVAVEASKVVDSGALVRTHGALDRVLTGGGRSIWLGGTSLPPGKLEQVIRHYVEHSDARAGLGRQALDPELLREANWSSPVISEAERRHARSVGRWLGAGVLFVYGCYVSYLPLVLAARLGPEPGGGSGAALVAVAVLALLLTVGLAHFVAAVGIALRREIARKVGLALSVIGLIVGGLWLLTVFAIGLGGDTRALLFPLLLLGGYGISALVLHLVENLTALAAPRAVPA